MGLFSRFKRKKGEEVIEVPNDELNDEQRALMKLLEMMEPCPTIPSQPIQNPHTTPKHKNEVEPDPSEDYVDEDYTWFYCTSCRTQVKKSQLDDKGNVQQLFRISRDNMYAPPLKWCKKCVANLAVKMGIDNKELINANKRMVLKSLRGNKNGKD